MKKNRRGAHAVEPSKSKQHHFILFLIILLIIGIMITYFNHNNNSDPKPEEYDNSSVPIINYLTLSGSHPIENSSNLLSKDISIDESNGISKVKGTIENSTDNDEFEKLNLVYTLYDDSKNVIYEFDISVSNLKANSYKSFSSVCAIDLSNVVSYSIKIVE